MRPHRTAGTGGDRGETLIEILLTVVIMGITVTAILGGVGVGVLMSDVHRKQATAGVAVRDLAEAVQDSVAGTGYVPCATAAAYASPPGYAAPAGYTASVVPTSVRYWTGGGWQAVCTVDSGLQRITVQVASTDGRASEQLDVVLRRPCPFSATAWC